MTNAPAPTADGMDPFVGKYKQSEIDRWNSEPDQAKFANDPAYNAWLNDSTYWNKALTGFDAASIASQITSSPGFTVASNTEYGKPVNFGGWDPYGGFKSNNETNYFNTNKAIVTGAPQDLIDQAKAANGQPVAFGQGGVGDSTGYVWKDGALHQTQYVHNSGTGLASILPIALSMLAPGVGTAIGSALGAGATFAPIVGGAVLGGGMAGLTGGDVLKGAVMGGVGGASGTQIGDTGVSVGDVSKSANIAKAANNGDLFGAITGAANLSGAANMPVGDTGFTVGELAKDAKLAAAVISGNPNAVMGAITSVANSAAKSEADANNAINPYFQTGAKTGDLPPVEEPAAPVTVPTQAEQQPAVEKLLKQIDQYKAPEQTVEQILASEPPPAVAPATPEQPAASETPAENPVVALTEKPAAAVKPTVTDTLTALKMYLGKIPMDSSYDTNGDGKITLTDVLNLQKSVAGKDVTFDPSSKWGTPAPVEPAAETDVVQQLQDAGLTNAGTSGSPDITAQEPTPVPSPTLPAETTPAPEPTPEPTPAPAADVVKQLLETPNEQPATAQDIVKQVTEQPDTAHIDPVQQLIDQAVNDQQASSAADKTNIDQQTKDLLNTISGGTDNGTAGSTSPVGPTGYTDEITGHWITVDPTTGKETDTGSSEGSPLTNENSGNPEAMKDWTFDKDTGKWAWTDPATGETTNYEYATPITGGPLTGKQIEDKAGAGPTPTPKPTPTPVSKPTPTPVPKPTPATPTTPAKTAAAPNTAALAGILTALLGSQQQTGFMPSVGDVAHIKSNEHLFGALPGSEEAPASSAHETQSDPVAAYQSQYEDQQYANGGHVDDFSVDALLHILRS
jgi:hypothetical protein